jgi:hypothetical protein
MHASDPVNRIMMTPVLTIAPILYRPGGEPRRRKRVFSEEELRSFVTNIDSICRTKKRKHVLMVLLLCR